MTKDDDDDILKLLSTAEADADRQATRALIIQPGAIGDCVLTLPVAEFIKKTFKIGTVAMLGRSHYMLYMPTRSCIDNVRDLDSIEMHRLFVPHKDFELQDDDPLITAFSGYQHIFNFLAASGSDFERNLIFTANCSNSVEVTSLPLKPPADCKHHITKFYIDTIANSCSHYIHRKPTLNTMGKKKYLKPIKSDLAAGREIIESYGIKKKYRPAVIHPGSGGVKKCWNIDNFYLLAEELLDAGESVIFLLGPAEQERLSRKVFDRLSVLAPVAIETSLSRTFQILSCAGCFVGNDSGISHIAAATGLPTITCFGPTDPTIYAPVGPKVKTFKLKESDFTHPCPSAVEQVSRAALKFLSS